MYYTNVIKHLEYTTTMSILYTKKNLRFYGISVRILKIIAISHNN